MCALGYFIFKQMLCKILTLCFTDMGKMSHLSSKAHSEEAALLLTSLTK